MLGFSDLLLVVKLTTLVEGAYKLVLVHTCLVVGLQLQLGYTPPGIILILIRGEVVCKYRAMLLELSNLTTF